MVSLKNLLYLSVKISNMCIHDMCIQLQVFKPHLPSLETLLSAKAKEMEEDNCKLVSEEDQLLESFMYRYDLLNLFNV